MDYQTQFWKRKLEELENKPTSSDKISNIEVRNWVAECVATFSYLGVNSEIIRGFMSMFEHVGSSQYSATSHWKGVYDEWASPAAQKRRIKEFFYPNIAFTSAYSLLEKIEEQERLVPHTLIDLLRSKTEFSHIAASLESMESAYEGKDVENLLAAIGPMLFGVINLNNDSGLQKLKRKPKQQLGFLSNQKNKKVLDDFGVDQELIELFQNFRYLRNILSQHKKANLPSVPLAVGYGFASLALIFLYGVMAKGKLIQI